MNTIELNQSLLQACTSEPVDYVYAEKLLQSGAKPLGRVLCGKEENNLYAEIVERYVCNEGDSDDFFKITELFIKYGMQINVPDIPYDDNDFLNPLWNFGFPINTGALRVLKLLLDNGLDADSAEEAWGHDFFDYFDVEGDLDNKESYEMLYDSLKKLLLIASYPHVLDADENLQKFIWLSQNSYDPLNFRDYNNFTFDVDTSRCLKYPEVYQSVITVKEKANGKVVWRMGLGLSPENI